MSYATLLELKSYLGITGTSEDVLLTTCAEAATAAIETYTKRRFIAVEGTREYIYEGRNVIYLDEDLAQLTSLKFNGEAVTRYRLYPVNESPKEWIRVFSLPHSPSWSNQDEQIFEVVGKWGYSLAPPMDVKVACMRWASYLYRLKDAQVFDVTYMPELGQVTMQKGVPKDVVELLSRYVKVSGL